jgi:hypothetical protein
LALGPKSPDCSDRSAWWASKADSRIEVLEKSFAAAGPQSANQGERLTRVEEKLVAVQAGILDIKSILERRR